MFVIRFSLLVFLFIMGCLIVVVWFMLRVACSLVCLFDCVLLVVRCSLFVVCLVFDH